MSNYFPTTNQQPSIGKSNNHLPTVFNQFTDNHGLEYPTLLQVLLILVVKKSLWEILLVETVLMVMIGGNIMLQPEILCYRCSDRVHKNISKVRENNDNTY